MPYVLDLPFLTPTSSDPVLLTDTLPTVDDPQLDGLPEYELQSVFVQRYLQAIANELRRLEQMRQEILQSVFPATSNALLGVYEQMLGLAVAPSALTLAQRRTTVLAYMQSLKAQGTGLAWEGTLGSLLGSEWSYAEHDPADLGSPPAYTVKLLIPYAGTATVPTLTAVPSGTAGTLAAGTYVYAVTARTPWGETVASSPQSATVTGTTSKVALSWTTSPLPATGYTLYRGPDSAHLVQLVQTTGTSFTDTGAVSPVGSGPPTTDTSASPTTSIALQLARAITPAHIDLEIGFTGGLLVGIGDVGDVL